ncbi:MAG: paraquat-inducible protein A [Pseudomonadota bacterium]
MADAPNAKDESLAHLIACPHCDALYAVGDVEKGERAACLRCHGSLLSRRKDAGLMIVALSLAAVILLVSALFLPFMEISRLGFSNGATILDTAWAFAGGPMFALSLAVVALIAGLPLLRLCLTLYTIAPLVFDFRALPGARGAFRLSQSLKPWSMVEIFVIGCAVSLVKLGDLARVEIGVAFWMFVIVVIFVVIQDLIMDAWSVWRALER